MRKINQENLFLFELSSSLYKQPRLKADEKNIDFNKLIKLSMKNNVLNYHSNILLKDYNKHLSEKNKKFLNYFNEKAEKDLKKIQQTIIYLKIYLPDYILLKTFRGYNRIPNDLDILVNNVRDISKILKKQGFSVIHHDPVDNEDVLVKQGYWKIHLHEKIGWFGKEFCDNNLVFSKHRIEKLAGQNITIPDHNIDLLIHLAHMNFEPLHITMSELVYIFSISKKINWRFVFEQARKYHWLHSLKRTLSLMNSIHNLIYGEIIFQEQKTANINSDISFPFNLPRQHIIQSFLEKRIFMQLLSRIPKILKILFKGETFDSFYEAPESRILKGAKT